MINTVVHRGLEEGGGWEGGGLAAHHFANFTADSHGDVGTRSLIKGQSLRLVQKAGRGIRTAFRNYHKNWNQLHWD